MKQLWSQIRGSIVFCGYVINTLFWATPLLLLCLIKLIPIKPLQNTCSSMLDFLASCWISCNGWMERYLHPISLSVTGATDLSKDDWYMVISNHQSWVDILVLQGIFNRKIPFLKFFLKRELIFVPVLGLVWWALDFPFMRRYSPTELKKNPKLKGKDIEITRKACSKFKYKPVSVMNFVEGTRFKDSKHAKQHSPFNHLLRPKAGGMAFALAAMPEINKIVDVTIHYADGVPSFFDYLSGKGGKISVDIQIRPITAAMRGDYQNDRQFKQQFQQELNQIWLHKDQFLCQRTSDPQHLQGEC
ncbi:acyltransferase [Shewanella sp. NIFS-20-20]|uniref:acyltransferase n=1 Tax=Shewanella sp. NIFS-20-20 TaxID=2853806 RepID=UPI001C477B62|nr:acyltransferase [Shewanella sp. NIFS-20-20]MBV7316780.1 acyltransferase [Shewanella sp. NIFS-20-20]